MNYAADKLFDTMTHASEIGAKNRLHFCRRSSYHIGRGWKFLALKINVAESDVGDEFAEVAGIIIAGIVDKVKLKRYES